MLYHEFRLLFQVVVNALIQAIPSICNVFMVCVVFWLIFGIMGIQMFAGTFYKCVDADNVIVPRNIVTSKNDCKTMEDEGYKWVNSDINFDNIGNAYLALFQVVSDDSGFPKYHRHSPNSIWRWRKTQDWPIGEQTLPSRVK